MQWTEQHGFSFGTRKHTSYMYTTLLTYHVLQVYTLDSKFTQKLLITAKYNTFAKKSITKAKRGSYRMFVLRYGSEKLVSIPQ